MAVHHRSDDVMLRLASRRRQPRGFTLLELIMVIVMLGVLSVFAAPRLFNNTDVYARGFHDETLALLRYAQKAAIAQRRAVCVTFSATSASLSMAQNPASPACGLSDVALAGPNKSCTAGAPTGAKGCITAGAGASYSAFPPTLMFDGLGQPTAASLQLQVATAGVAIAKTVTIEASTGYVHD